MCVIYLFSLQKHHIWWNNNLLVVFVSEFIKLVFIDQIKSIRWKFVLLSSACCEQSRTVYKRGECSQRGERGVFTLVLFSDEDEKPDKL